MPVTESQIFRLKILPIRFLKSLQTFGHRGNKLLKRIHEPINDPMIHCFNDHIFTVFSVSTANLLKLDWISGRYMGRVSDVKDDAFIENISFS